MIDNSTKLLKYAFLTKTLATSLNSLEIIFIDSLPVTKTYICYVSLVPTFYVGMLIKVENIVLALMQNLDEFPLEK